MRMLTNVFFFPRNLFYDSAPPQLVVSPGAGSYTRHLEQQQLRQQQQPQLRLAKGTGRQPNRRPRRNEHAVSTSNQRDASTATGGAEVDAISTAPGDPLGDRRMADTVDRIRQENPGQEVERWGKITSLLYHRSCRNAARQVFSLSPSRAPMEGGGDPRFRYYGKLRSMFRESAGVRPPAVPEEEVTDVEADGGGGGGGGGRTTVNGVAVVNAEDGDNPFDSFLVCKIRLY